MTTDDEIAQLWKKFSETKKPDDAIVEFYRQAEKDGKESGIAAMEQELATDQTAQAAVKMFGWGKGARSSIITLKAILREAACIAAQKVKK